MNGDTQEIMNLYSLNKQSNDPSEQDSFYSVRELADARQFIEEGYRIQTVESPSDLERIRKLVHEAACQYLVNKDIKTDDLLDYIHQYVTPDQLNDLRLHIINTLNGNRWVRPAYFRLARHALESIVGNELAMQLRLNLSIQMPEDDSSLLPIHADTWSGDSPFEVVVWVPLVNCYATKSMYLLPPTVCGDPAQMLTNTYAQDSETLFHAVEKDLVWLNVKYGQVLVFNQNLPHGNRINRESETRWTLNCRFKGVFTPYADKRLGEFFEPITLRPASRQGLDYHLSETRNHQAG